MTKWPEKVDRRWVREGEEEGVEAAVCWLRLKGVTGELTWEAVER